MSNKYTKFLKTLQVFSLLLVIFVFPLHDEAFPREFLTSDQIQQMLEKTQPIVPEFEKSTSPLRTRSIVTTAKMPVTQEKNTETPSASVVFNDVLIRFDTNSAQPTKDSLRQLQELAKALQSSKFKRNSFMLVGHTDRRGSASYNQKLSERRAESVKKFIASHSAVQSSRILTSGKGEEEPLDKADTKTAWRKNRRVELFLLPMAEAIIVYRKLGENTKRILKSGQTINSGDELAFHFSAFENCYLYIFTVDTENSVSKIFPQDGSNEENAIKSGQSIRLPVDRSRWYSLDSNIGIENVYICATRRPANTDLLLAEISKAHQIQTAPVSRAITGTANTQQIIDEKRRNLWQEKYDYVKHILFKHQ